MSEHDAVRGVSYGVPVHNDGVVLFYFFFELGLGMFGVVSWTSYGIITGGGVFSQLWATFEL